MKRLKNVGFWNDSENNYPEFPYPQDLISSSDNYDFVADYIDQEMKFGSAYKGFSKCRICGQRNGFRDKYDKKFLCPEGYSHYIRDHNVAPDLELVKFVRKLKGK